MNLFSERWSMVRCGMEQAAARSGRSVSEIALVAVSKGHPVEAIAEACEAGQILFGESRVQEAKEKIASVKGVHWHLIGHLQKNKVRQALPLFKLIESVHSLDLAKAIDRVAGEASATCRVLLEVNIGGEGSKHGFAPEDVGQQMEILLELSHLQIDGLMAIPPYAEEAEASRWYFVQLRELRDALEKEFSIRLPTLSMGMSGDYEVAIEEGATLVRVGTALFGERAAR
jgi:PLP dependent protein